MENRSVFLIQKEIEIVRKQYEELESSFFLSNEKKENIEKERDKKIKDLMDLYDKLENRIQSIENNTERIVIRLWINGKTYREIGKEIGYEKNKIYRIIKKYKKKGTK